jgi:hypothetical protein
MRAPFLPAIALLATACAAGQVLGSTGTWQQPAVTLSADGAQADSANVASGPAGVATAAWRRSNGSHFIIQAARYSGGAWGAPVDLSLPGETAYVPKLAVDAAGVVTAAWAREDGVVLVVQASRFEGGTWSAPATLGQGTQPSVAAGPAGSAVVLFEQFDGTDWVVRASHRAGGAWTPAVDVSARGPIVASVGDVAMDPSGAATAVWTRNDGPSGQQLVQAARLTGGTWSAPASISPVGQDAYAPAVTVDASGVATTAWSEGVDRIRTARLVGGSWAPSGVLVPRGPFPRLAAGAQGEVTMVWSGDDGPNRATRVAQFSGGAWDAGVNLFPPTTDLSYNPQVAALPSAGAVASWSRGRDAGFLPQAAVLAGGTWSAPVDLGPVTPSVPAPWVSADSSGIATVVWQASNGTHDEIRAARYTPASPAPQPVAAKAALSARLLPSARRLVSGQSMRLGVRIANTGGSAATGVTACVRLPANLIAVRSRGFTRSGQRMCTSLGTVPPGGQITRVVEVRAIAARRVVRTVTATATGDGLSVVRAAPRTVIISPRVSRAPVTG